MKKNSLNGKIREFDKNKKIRENQGILQLLSKKLTNGGFFSFKVLNLMRINFLQTCNTL